MKSADITVGKLYVASFGAWKGEVCVKVVDVGVESGRFSGLDDRTKSGVEVKLAEPVGRSWSDPGKPEFEVGSIAVVAPRRIVREWTSQDDELRIEQAQEKARKDALRLRFEALGFTSRLSRDEEYKRRDAKTLARREGRPEPDFGVPPRLLVDREVVEVDRVQFEELLALAESFRAVS